MSKLHEALNEAYAHVCLSESQLTRANSGTFLHSVLHSDKREELRDLIRDASTLGRRIDRLHHDITDEELMAQADQRGC